MKKRKGRKAFWHNIKFKYKLAVINENTLEEVFGLHVSKLNGFSVLMCACVVIFLIAAVIIIFTPLRNYLPGYMDSQMRSRIVENALRADSLQVALDRQNYYIMNIKDILDGHVKVDTVQSIDSLTDKRAEELVARSKEEDEYRKRYEEEERYNLTAIGHPSDMAGVVFYRPVRGVISDGFNPDTGHFGIDLTPDVQDNVLAPLDGTVIFASYTAEWGYVIQIQHDRNFVTIYKHCDSLMHREGEKVRGGEVVALIGKNTVSGESSHLHFELWYKGSPINPEKYIVF